MLIIYAIVAVIIFHPRVINALILSRIAMLLLLPLLVNHNHVSSWFLPSLATDQE